MLMPAVVKFRSEPGAHDPREFFRRCYAGAQRQDTCVIMFARQSRNLFIPGADRAHAGTLLAAIAIPVPEPQSAIPVRRGHGQLLRQL